MLPVTQINAFRDELSKIAQVKCANTAALLPQNQPPPPAPSISGGSTAVKVKAPKKGGLLKSAPTYSKVNSDPVTSPSAGVQSFSAAPVAKS